MWATALLTVIIVPNLKTEWVGPLPGKVAGWMRPLSYAQSWRMYAPDPQRSQAYMNLTAHYPDGRKVPLEETAQERAGWDVTWAANKTRVDIWRHYANFRPKRRSEHRKWYLRAACIREARKGEVPTKIVMQQVRRGFTNPKKVAKGKPGLGKRRTRTVEWMPCKTRMMLKMIDEDRALHGLPALGEAS